MFLSKLSRRDFYAGILSGVLIIGAIFSAACGKADSKAADQGEGRQNRQQQRSNEQPVAVMTARTEARDIPSYIQATGTLVAEETSDVSSPASGQVISTPVNVGAYVTQGTVLARLDDRDARLRLRQSQASVEQSIAAVRQAEARLGLGPGGNFTASNIPEVQAAAANLEQATAELRQAEANEKRYRDLVQTGDVAMATYETYRTQRDTARARVNAARQQQEAAINAARQNNQAIQSAQAAVESARAQVAIAQKAVNDTIIRAPFSGYLSTRPIALGEYVTPSSIIATILRTGTIKLQMQVPESDAPFITAGMGVSLEVDAFKDRKFAGTVTAVNPAIDPASRAATVEAAVNNSGNQLRSGMFATARIARPGGNKGVFVPRAAVMSDQNTQSYRAFVIVQNPETKENVAKLRVVQLAPVEEGDMVQILSGINADEIVATSNLAELYEGAKVLPQQ